MPAAALGGWTLTLFIAAFLWGSAGTALVYGALAWMSPRQPRWARIGTIALWLGFVATLVVMPGVLEHA